MPSPRCNLVRLQDTMNTFHSVRRSLPIPTSASILRSIRAAQAAANRGQCAEMHRHGDVARAAMERRLDMLLGRR